MSSFEALSAELTGFAPGLSPFLADTYINRAWRSIRDARLWSFLVEDCGIFCPVQITAGTVSITQFSEIVVCDATASAALLALSLPSPLDLTAMQIRFGGSGTAAQTGQVYSIIDFDGSNASTLTLTLDRVVMEPTDSAASYQSYRCYIRPTVDDFLRWESLVDMTNGWRLKLNYTSTMFDMRDPQRQAQGMAYYLGAFKGNPELQPKPQYELWPVPTSGQTFYGRYRRQGEDFTDPADTLPVIIPDLLVIERALGWHVYPWIAANMGHFPAFKGVGIINLMLTSKKAYMEMLMAAKKQDSEQELQSSDVWNRGHGLIHSTRAFKGMTDYPIDSNFIQSHLVNF